MGADGDAGPVAAEPAPGGGGGGFRPVAMISREGCAHCRRAKDALERVGARVEELSLSSSAPREGRGRDDLFRSVQGATGRSSVPQIFLAARPGEVLGADELEAVLADPGFDAAALAGAAGADPLPARVRRAFASLAAEGARDLSPSTSGAAAGRAFADAILVDGGVQRFGLEYSQLFGLAVELGDGGALLAGRPSFFGLTRGLLQRDRDRSFSSRQLVQWLMRTGHAPGEDAAVRLGQRMLSYNFIAPPGTYGAAPRGGGGADEVRETSRSSSASAREDFSGRPDQPFVAFREYAGNRPTVLNLGLPWPAIGAGRRGAGAVAAELRERLESLYGAHLSRDGRHVDYAALAGSASFRALVDATCELQTCDLGGMTRAQLMAFAINVYNILIVHATTALGTPESLLKRLRFFDTVGYDIGGVVYSANDIEHGLLRANAPSPAALASLAGYPNMAPRTFRAADARCRYAGTVGAVDPRVHFALVCGAKSCPPIRVFDAENLELGLEAAAEAFVDDDVEMDEANGELMVTVSKIFQWYAGDFGSSKEDTLAFVRKYLRGGKGELLGRYLDQPGGAAGVKVAYRTYDWSVNGSPPPAGA